MLITLVHKVVKGLDLAASGFFFIMILVYYRCFHAVWSTAGRDTLYLIKLFL